MTGLTASFVTSESGSAQTVKVQDDAFTRDVMGRVVTSTSAVPVIDGTTVTTAVTAECFAYDGLNRLGAAWTVAGSGAATCGAEAPAAAGAAGWDGSGTTYAAKWSYSAGGKITGLVKGAGASAVTSTYSYMDPAHPAAVTSVADGTSTDGFTYDAAGRMVSRTVDGVTTALTWDVTSSLVESNGQGGHVVYAYDASGQRVAQATLARPGGGANGTDLPGTASAYVASGQVDDPNTAIVDPNALTATRYYTFGGSTVAMRTNDGSLSLMLGDEQGSTNVVMPVHVQASGALAPATLADAAAVTRTSYTPYGELRGTVDNTATDRGWLGQVEDRVDGATGTGLTYLNARYYDPAAMRFISPDPLMNPGDPKTLDPYRYADNNPVMATDASGLGACYGLKPEQEKQCMTQYNSGTSYEGEAGPGADSGGSSSSGGSSGASSGSSADIAPPPVCGTGFTCGSSEDDFYGTWYGAAFGGLENWVRGATDSVIGLADLAITGSCTTFKGGLLTSSGRSCWHQNGDGGWHLPRIGSSGFKNAEWSYFIGSVDNPTLLIGGGGGGGEAAMELEAATSTVVRDAAESCLNSFTGDTPVLMADGTEKAIADVKIGDKVLATDPETGVSKAKPVTALIRHGGKHTMVEFTLADGSVLTSTDHHPIWDATTTTFTDAINLRVGEDLLGANGQLLAIAGERIYDQDLTAYNLQIDGIHTYYAGNSPVLVHNSCDPTLFRFGTEAESAESLASQAAAAEANGFPHGVSVFSRSTRPDAVAALLSRVEESFTVTKTGTNAYHYTVELPNPVTQEVADAFNAVFGRAG